MAGVAPVAGHNLSETIRIRCTPETARRWDALYHKWAQKKSYDLLEDFLKDVLNVAEPLPVPGSNVTTRLT